jgi:hypothetical protein
MIKVELNDDFFLIEVCHDVDAGSEALLFCQMSGSGVINMFRSRSRLFVGDCAHCSDLTTKRSL